jgi:cell division protein FtsB
MKKIIMLCTIIGTLISNTTMFGMLLKQCRAIAATKNITPARQCNKIAQFNYDEIILQLQKENNLLKQEITSLRRENELLHAQTNTQPTRSIAQETIDFKASDRRSYHEDRNS